MRLVLFYLCWSRRSYERYQIALFSQYMFTSLGGSDYLGDSVYTISQASHHRSHYEVIPPISPGNFGSLIPCSWIVLLIAAIRGLPHHLLLRRIVVIRSWGRLSACSCERYINLLLC